MGEEKKKRSERKQILEYGGSRLRIARSDRAGREGCEKSGRSRAREEGLLFLSALLDPLENGNGRNRDDGRLYDIRYTSSDRIRTDSHRDRF